VSFIAPCCRYLRRAKKGKNMSKAKKTLLLAGASAFAILASVAGVNAETP
jgi:hypothetical protein